MIYHQVDLQMYPNISDDSVYLNIDNVEPITLLFQTREFSDSFEKVTAPTAGALTTVSDAVGIRRSSRTWSLGIDHGKEEREGGGDLWETLHLPSDNRQMVSNAYFTGKAASDVHIQMLGIDHEGKGKILISKKKFQNFTIHF